MLRRVSTGITLSTLVSISSIYGCTSVIEQVLPAKETSTTPVAKVSSSSPFNTLEQSIHKQINNYRATRNLPPMDFDPRLSEIARGHSQAMASGKVPFSHEGFDGRVQAIRRVFPFYRAVAENVAYNLGYSNPGEQAVEGWIKSKGHRINIEGQYNLTGIGVVQNAKGEYYFTQLFVLRR